MSVSMRCRCRVDNVAAGTLVARTRAIDAKSYKSACGEANAACSLDASSPGCECAASPCSSSWSRRVSASISPWNCRRFSACAAAQMCVNTRAGASASQSITSPSSSRALRAWSSGVPSSQADRRSVSPRATSVRIHRSIAWASRQSRCEIPPSGSSALADNSSSITADSVRTLSAARPCSSSTTG
jgi:hypothetical protein